MNEPTLDDSRVPTPPTTPGMRVSSDASGTTIGRYEILEKVPADDDPVHRQIRTEATTLLR